ncbi:MAG: hypothetical protein SGBAC_008711 [Bacillariaceae sp.]
MNFTGKYSSDHQRTNNTKTNGTILKDEENTEHGSRDSDDNAAIAGVSSVTIPGGGSRDGSSDSVGFKSDVLTIFQAAPLACMMFGTNDSKKGLSPIGESQYLEEERNQISRIFSRTQVAAEFKIATHDALGTFLAEDKGRILHLSCHGDAAGSLFLEDDWGGLAPLDKDNLKRWVQLGGQELQFVFVSTSHASQSIGQAFVDAGVPHVVVCSKANNANYLQLRVSDALFEKTFYRNLAQNNKTVQEAFDIAKDAILVDPKIPEEHRSLEEEKYCLLGRADHDVPVFFQRNISVVSQSARRPPEGFTLPPKDLIGRSIDQYRILKKLQHARLTCVHGPSGMGKTSLVKAVCQYVHYRLNMMDFSDIQWIGTSPTDRLISRSEESLLQPLFDLIHSSTLAPSNFLKQACEPFLHLVETFKDRKTLLVVDAKHIVDQQAVRKLGIFLDEFIKATWHVKVIVIYDDEDSIEACRLSVEHQSYAVGPLSFEWSARLFSRLCPEKLLHENHYGIGTSQHLCEMLLQSSPSEHNISTTVTPRIQMLWGMLGGGDPRHTVDVAKVFTRQQYLDLLTLSANKDDIDLTLEKLLQMDSKIDEIEKRREIYERRSDEQNIAACRRMLNELERQREVYSRANLERRQEKLHTEYEAARKDERFGEAQELNHKQEQLALIIEQVPTLIWLEKRREEVEFEFKLAKHKDNLQAGHLHRELKRTIAAIAAERNSLGATDIPVSRASLEARILQLEAEKKTAVTCCDFAKAVELKPEIYRLKQMQGIVPSAEELRKRITSLDSSLQKAVDEEDYNSAETLFNRLEEIRAKLRAEEEAEKSYGIQVASDIIPMMKVQSEDSRVARQAAMDPGDEESAGSSDGIAADEEWILVMKPSPALQTQPHLPTPTGLTVRMASSDPSGVVAGAESRRLPL